jgi:hypothetical protein
MTKHRRKVGRPRKKAGEPVEHHLTPKMRKIIVAMVEDGLTYREAADAAGIAHSTIYRAMKTRPAQEFYMTELRALLHCTKHLAAHALIKELAGDNAAARVASARTLLADDAKPVPPAGMAQTPGFVFMVVDGRGAGQALPNGHAAPPMIDVRPAAPAHAGDEIDGYE